LAGLLIFSNGIFMYSFLAQTLPTSVLENLPAIGVILFFILVMFGGIAKLFGGYMQQMLSALNQRDNSNMEMFRQLLERSEDNQQEARKEYNNALRDMTTAHTNALDKIREGIQSQLNGIVETLAFMSQVQEAQARDLGTIIENQNREDELKRMREELDAIKKQSNSISKKRTFGG